MNKRVPTLSQIAKGHAFFRRYNSGSLIYNLAWSDEEGDTQELEFPIPIDDCGEGDFTYMMKGTSVLRWARKQVEIVNAENEKYRTYLNELREPRTSDYCKVCGESPDSGSHLPHGHTYVAPWEEG